MPHNPNRKRATLAELKRFANKVRKAGGSNPLDALMPSVPDDTTQCLIAKNLNFNCEVTPSASAGRWLMIFEDKEVRDKVAKKLKLGKRNITGGWTKGDRFAVYLPVEIGRVADDFDKAGEILGRFAPEYGDTMTQYERVLVEEMWPYIEESVKEAYELADYITPEGKIVL